MYRDAYDLAKRSGIGKSGFAAASESDRSAAIVQQDVPDKSNLQKDIIVPSPQQAALSVKQQQQQEQQK